MLDEHDAQRWWEPLTTMTGAERPRLALSRPATYHARPGFFDGTLEDLQRWVAELPAHDLPRTTRLLHGALTELNHTQLAFDQRYQLLETLRPPTHYAALALSNQFLNRPVTADGPAQRLATVTQGLQAALATGYRTVVADGIQNDRAAHPLGPEGGDGRVIAGAVHRSMTDQSLTLLRALQVYTSAPQRAWQHLHRLYLVAEHLNLLDFRLDDTEQQSSGATTVASAYLRPVMLITAQPYNLRQNAITGLFHALADWTALVRILGPCQREHEGFVVDLDDDRGPRDLRYVEGVMDEACRVVQPAALVQRLDDWLSDRYAAAEDQAFDVPAFVDAAWVRHAASAWGQISKRAYRRASASTHLEVVLGLPSIHAYLLSGHGAHSHGRAPEPRAGASRADAPVEAAPATVQRIEVIDVSAHGYGLLWRGDVPPHLRPGELIALHASIGHHWAIAVVRWLHADGDSMRLGVQLLAPRARPISMRPIRTQQSSLEWRPALLLPEVAAIEQTAMLLTPPLDLLPRQKVEVSDQDEALRLQLLERREATEDFLQFGYRTLEEPAVHITPSGMEIGTASEDEFWAAFESFGLDATRVTGGAPEGS